MPNRKALIFASKPSILDIKNDQGLDTVALASDSKPKKKICCACPDAKKLRDECTVEHGESACEKWIEAHKRCLRAEGFNI
ncbi:cytochrome c oxidase copper chaperone 2 [Olea europaea subsp. europaea]|uniref:Cytochrome c oxidase copper chaperone 2 n=1 Tax=Olea europaea subsp. europaea TaxID=158383 RepID=A0A8S0V1H2_OLEEU|nr:cytochrome c oxidase copper chaperone 2 [Olea europaea subsp. europaea]